MERIFTANFPNAYKVNSKHTKGLKKLMDITAHKNVFLRTSKTKDSLGDIWFFHGFGESGLSFIEAFTSPLTDKFNLFIPDLPGFGVSPLEGSALDQKQTADLLRDVILNASEQRPLFLVGHSQGGLIATWLCKEFGGRVKAYANVEGNLTKADVTFSGEAAKKNNPKECKAHILSFIRENANNEESFWRYYASLRFASPEALLTWAKAGIEYTGETQAGEEYLALMTPKLYLWGQKSCPQQTKDFLSVKGLNSESFDHSHHWPMIDVSEKFYKLISDFFQTPLK